jgi:hypothetical protein
MVCGLGRVDPVITAILIKAHDFAGVIGVNAQAAADGGRDVVWPKDEARAIMRAGFDCAGEHLKRAVTNRALAAQTEAGY